MRKFLACHWLDFDASPVLYRVPMTPRRALVLALLVGAPLLGGLGLWLLGLADVRHVVLGGLVVIAGYEAIGFVVLRFGLLLDPAKVRQLTHAFAAEADTARGEGAQLPVSVAFKAFSNFEPWPINDPLSGMIIDEFGCRVCGELKPGEGKPFTVYLAGDCTFFDIHLKSEDSVVCHLERALNARAGDGCFRVVSAAFQHYVALHAVVRAALHMSAMPVHCVALACGINDVLACLHTEGKVAYDLSNRYLSSNGSGAAPAARWILKHSRLARALYLRWGDPIWDQAVYVRNPNYIDPKVLAAARAGFSTQLFEQHVSTFIGLCRHRDIPLLLTTVKYRRADMLKDPRRFVAEGIDQLNEAIISLGERYSVPVVRLDRYLPDDEDYVFNKWHFTPRANQLRASLLAPEILKALNRKRTGLSREALNFERSSAARG